VGVLIIVPAIFFCLATLLANPSYKKGNFGRIACRGTVPKPKSPEGFQFMRGTAMRKMAFGGIFIVLAIFLLGAMTHTPVRAGTPGDQKWAFSPGFAIVGSPAIGADGTIYVGADNGFLYAVTAGSQKWLYNANIIGSSPAVGPDGTIYVGSWDGKLYAVNPDGSQKWAFSKPFSSSIESSPAIGADGTIYVGLGVTELNAINPDGSFKWAFATGNLIQSSPAVGADGTIYVGSRDYKLYAINPNNSLKWAFTTGDYINYSSPAVGPDGTVYVGSHDSYLYAIYGDSPGLAQSSWPMFHHDVRHTGTISKIANSVLSLLLLLE
jgi:outer membrane protein assembly factor BamB